ncbi:MAG: twin-arginine translocase TatA/TatE family subunit [Deltaproteobacteria bacterium HGW-Deltaproteobacteria-21]|nr:MAG: twin-arginine translocase TatA/TatE family subunit [Deltaproteobacteria bacterium HGW-Deltaproteobacteria-21]PKN63617.1 MAG: twin-arginine translocase TatA/TatE family subunit [Deltaproteobacteria bacterium HGW-Deltaproteobacteria-15]
MFGLGSSELIVIGVIVFLIFGAKRLPEIGKGLGGAIREFRNIKKDVTGKESEPIPSLNEHVKKQVVQRFPGAKQIMDLKEKVDKVDKIVTRS